MEIMMQEDVSSKPYFMQAYICDLFVKIYRAIWSGYTESIGLKSEAVMFNTKAHEYTLTDLAFLIHVDTYDHVCIQHMQR